MSACALAEREGVPMFVMENGNGKDDGRTSCGHMEVIQHANYHDTGQNGNGRAPDTDCMGVVDAAGHPMGGPYRLLRSRRQPLRNVCWRVQVRCKPVGPAQSQSAAAGPQPPTIADDAGENEWILVGCFVSDQDGGSHADPWADGNRWVPLTWEQCRQKAVDEGSTIRHGGEIYCSVVALSLLLCCRKHSFSFPLCGAHQFLDQPGVSNCGHMELIEHGNYHEGDAASFFGIQGTRDTGHDGHGRAPATDCTGLHR